MCTYLGQPGTTCERYRALIKFTGAYACSTAYNVYVHTYTLNTTSISPFLSCSQSLSLFPFFKVLLTCRRNIGRMSAVLFARTLPLSSLILLLLLCRFFMLPFFPRFRFIYFSLVSFVPFVLCVYLSARLAFLSVVFCCSFCLIFRCFQTSSTR